VLGRDDRLNAKLTAQQAMVGFRVVASVGHELIRGTKETRAGTGAQRVKNKGGMKNMGTF
jgi:hypothetical protein